MPYARSHHKWALDYARSYFGWSEKRIKQIVGNAGWRFMHSLWDEDVAAGDPGNYYRRPEHVVRQEWFHGYSLKRIPPGHAFFLNAKAGNVLYDFGCGTAECERLDWIDRDMQTILTDLPETANWDYIQRKYYGYQVEFCPSGQAMTRRYDRLLCFDVLEHVKNPMCYIEAMWESLRPGGQAVLWFDSAYPRAGHLAESVAQIPLYDKWLNKNATIFWRGLFDWVEKPRRWWQIPMFYS